jgi:tetratricopeptide (TPR) repeat protein
MHPTIFELSALCRLRLPAAQTEPILDHLRSGCARCLGTMGQRLTAWMDDDVTAEVRERATPPGELQTRLQTQVLLAAERAGRAAARRRAKPAADARVDRVRAELEAEGLSALGRLPRQLLGPPAIEALLDLARGLGLQDPGLRLRALEIAMDLTTALVEREGAACGHRDLGRRVALDLAHIHRMLGNHRAAQEQIDRCHEQLPPGDPLAAAGVLRSQATLLGDQGNLPAALAGLAAASGIYRRLARPNELARTLVGYGLYAGYAGRFDRALERHGDALGLIDAEREPLLACAAVGNSCDSLRLSGRHREALQLLRRHATLLASNPSVLNRARFSRLEGHLLKHSGDPAGADRAFAASRGAFESFGRHYVAAAVTLDQASARQRWGDWDGARALIAQGTEALLRTDPQREVYLAVMLLRATARFSAMSAALPLDRVIDFLDAAEFNPALRFQGSLAAAP